MSKEIQVKIKDEKAMLFTPYNMDFVKRIKRFSDARWDTRKKCWTINKENLDAARVVMREICTIGQFLKIILETKPEDYGCIVIFDSKDRPLDSYHYKNSQLTHDFTNENIDEKTIQFAFGNGSGTSMDYTLTVS